MDRSLTNRTPDLSHADSSLEERIIAGHNAILSQVEYFRAHFGTAESRWKKDGTRVTIVDETISRELFHMLHKEFPCDDYCSEEGAETPEPIPTDAEFCWILDPVDGTNNYAVGFLNAVSLWDFSVTAYPFTDLSTIMVEIISFRVVKDLEP